MDTGAKSCALHAEDIVIFKRAGLNWVRFRLNPKAKSIRKGRKIEALLVGKRKIRSSIGVETLRPVIKTLMVMGDHSFEVEITLVNRDIMGHRMLVGRSALRQGFLVDGQRTFVLGRSAVKKKIVSRI